MSEADLSTILNDPTKRVEGDIDWEYSPSGSPDWVKFGAAIRSEPARPLSVRGNYSRTTGKLSSTIVYGGGTRVYPLDSGGAHRANGRLFTGPRKHRWSDASGEADDVYEPGDITAGPADVSLAWEEFRKEFGMTHAGRLGCPPPTQQGFT